jgi:hypothetical protein
MEFWYSNTTAPISNNNYTLYSVQSYSDGPLYPSGSIETFRISNFPTGTYYWRTRAIGPNSNSVFSEASDAFAWTVLGGAISGTQIDDNSISGSKVISGDPAKTGSSQSNGFFDTLGPIAIAGLGLASLYAGYKKGWFDKILPKEYQNGFPGGGNDPGTQPSNPSIWPLQPKEANAPVFNVGDTITLVGDATPEIGNIEDYANFTGYDVPPYDYGAIAPASPGEPSDTGPVFRKV